MSGAGDLSLGQLATLACTLEVCAPKPGNVHRSADFEDVTLQDFLASAIAIGPVFDQAATLSLGQLVLDGVQATAQVCRTNTNLGMLLLFAPLAKASVETDLQANVKLVIEESTSDDAKAIYEAIRLAQPGGLQNADQHDVAGQAPAHILNAMQLASERDFIARQYASGFSDLFDTVLPLLTEPTRTSLSLSHRIVHAHVSLMATFPDTLIARKNGEELAMQSSTIARRVLDAGQPFDEDYLQQLSNLDFWLRCNGHKRNPGTTADMIAAGLLVCLRQKSIVAPFV